MSVTFKHYPGSLASNIWWNNAYKISYIRNITERRRNGDWMALNGHWNVPSIQSTEWWLKGDWMAPFSFHGTVAVRLVSTKIVNFMTLWWRKCELAQDETPPFRENWKAPFSHLSVTIQSTEWQVHFSDHSVTIQCHSVTIPSPFSNIQFPFFPYITDLI